MLEKKDLIQKSFRIDRKLDEALSELSKILNRSQNELIDYAIRLLIDQNKRWFAEGFVDEFYNEMVDELYKAKSEIIEDFECVLSLTIIKRGKEHFLHCMNIKMGLLRWKC